MSIIPTQTLLYRLCHHNYTSWFVALIVACVAASTALHTIPVEANLTPNETKFFVSVDGNDQWSGSLPEPNQDQSDGPFATRAPVWG